MQIHKRLRELEVGIKFRHFEEKDQELQLYNQKSIVINLDSDDDENNYKKVVVDLAPIEDV